MKTLVADLHDNNVIFSYYGFIDESVLNEVLRITQSKLEGNKESPQIVSKVSELISDCVDNIIKHNFYPEDSRVKYKSLLVVAKKGNDYSIDTINKVNEVQKTIIDEHLDYLNTRSKEDLNSLRAKSFVQTASVDTLTAPGLVELVLKADDFTFNCKKLEDSYLFNIHFKVNSLN